MKLPELLAPAGDYRSFIAAVENGADAVYLGGQVFNARRNAPNFREEEIKKALEYAQVRGRRVYVTVNILIKEQEMDEALDYVYQLQDMGVNGVIVQDLGLMYLLGRIFPDLRVHASTQMAVHNSEGVKLLGGLGVSRVVLARELSREDIKKVRADCPDMELEVFVHGALCYSYSGRCLMSSVVGGRSGNRGLCAQPCRLRYRLEGIGEQVKGHLLSPADLCLMPVLEDLVKSGVDSLKIEGRMKRPEYVAVVTRAYRHALDALPAGKLAEVTACEMENLASVFNRNFTVNQWPGPNKKCLSILKPNNRGVAVGRVVSQSPSGRAKIKLTRDLHLGDGLEIWVSSGDSPAFFVKEMWVEGQKVEEAKKGSVVELTVPGRVKPHDRVFRTHDHLLMLEAQATLGENREENKVPITVKVEVKKGFPLLVELRDPEGNVSFECSEEPVQTAKNAALVLDDLKEKIMAFGPTPFRVERLNIELEDGVMVPFSLIKRVRREAVERLKVLRLEKMKPPALKKADYCQRKKETLSGCSGPERTCVLDQMVLAVKVGSVPGAKAAVEAGADRIYFFWGWDRKEETILEKVMELKCLAEDRGCRFYLHLPPVLKPNDDFDWSLIEELQPQGLLVADLGLLNKALGLGCQVAADYHLNVMNRASLFLLRSLGVNSVCLSPEVNLRELGFITQDGLEFEYFVHGRLCLMISEHCIIGNVGEKGCCGCSFRNGIVLFDEKGYGFPLANDRYCRQYVFNSRVTCLVDDLVALKSRGVKAVRLELLLEEPELIQETVAIYREALAWTEKGAEHELARLRKELEEIWEAPFTRLHLQRGVQ